MKNEKKILQLKNISKSYFENKANSNISLSLEQGNIHGLLGENGSGKSTLLKIICGIHQPDSGSIYWEEQPIKMKTPSLSRSLGINMIFQHFFLFESLTVAENIALSTSKKLTKKLFNLIKESLEYYNISLNLQSIVSELSVSDKQKLEILRCLMQHPRLLIMDEPTSILAPQECEQLFNTLEIFSQDGGTVLYVSHKLEEVIRLCSSATILRQGKVVAVCNPQQENKQSIVEKMIGQAMKKTNRIKEKIKSTIGFSVKNLIFHSEIPFVVGLKNISFSIKGGDILGIAGLANNGQIPLLEILSGIEPIEGKERIIFNTQDITSTSIVERRKKGIVYVPEERIDEATIPDFTLEQNTLLTSYEKGLKKKMFINSTFLKNTTLSIIQDFNVITQNTASKAKSLSGGNLQKYSVGRELIKQPKVILIASPTWGIDPQSVIHIHQALIDAAQNGNIVILVSQELEEIFSICSKIAVLYQGELSPIFDREDISLSKIGLLMTGSTSLNSSIS